MNFVKVPRELIYDVELGNKRVALFCYLYSRKSLDDRIAFSIKDICSWLEMKPNTRKGKSNNQVLQMLNDFSFKGYTSNCFNFCDIPLSDTDTYHFTFVGENLIPEDNFAIIYIDELKKILNYKANYPDMSNRINIGMLLLVLSYVRVNMNMDKSKPLCCYRFYSAIGDELGIDSKYIKNIFLLLDKMKIIYQHSNKRSKFVGDNGNDKYMTSIKIFADYRKLMPDNKTLEEYDPIFQTEWQSELIRKYQKQKEK